MDQLCVISRTGSEPFLSAATFNVFGNFFYLFFLQQGRNCSHCFKINGCTGCEVNGNSIINLQSCDNLAVQLVNISRWEAERVSKVEIDQYLTSMMFHSNVRS